MVYHCLCRPGKTRSSSLNDEILIMGARSHHSPAVQFEGACDEAYDTPVAGSVLRGGEAKCHPSTSRPSGRKRSYSAFIAPDGNSNSTSVISPTNGVSALPGSGDDSTHMPIEGPPTGRQMAKKRGRRKLETGQDAKKP